MPDGAGLRRAALALRPAVDGDLAFLRDLYATTRADELAATGWPDAAQAAFLDSQFALQHRHVVAEHPGGDFWIVMRRGRPVGRLYVDRTAPVWRLIDIALLPASRATGAGSALLRWLQHAARRGRAEGIELHVLHANPAAARLYDRLGFVTAIAASAAHRRMIWRAPPG